MKTFYISKHDNIDQKMRVIENINKLLAESENNLEIRITQNKSLRTLQQNKSLHKYFALVSEALNEQGQDFSKVFDKPLNIKITPNIIKECMWKIVQNVMYGKQSTTELLKSEEIESIYDVINKKLSERFGIYVPFPNKE